MKCYTAAGLTEADPIVDAAKKLISTQISVACLFSSAEETGIDNQFATPLQNMASFNTNSPFESVPRVINKKNYYTLVSPRFLTPSSPP